MGRASEYTPEMGERICEAIAHTNRGIDWICGNTPDFPNARTVHRWLSKNEEFSQNYARAKARQADFLFEECLEIADDGTNDVMIINRNGVDIETTNMDVVQRSKLRVDTRKWIVSKLLPKKYGDKIEVEASKTTLDALASVMKGIRGRSDRPSE